MFRFQIYSLTVILLLGGVASFVLDSLDQVGVREHLFEQQIEVARLGAETSIDRWVSSCVDRATKLANQPAILGQLKALQQSAPKERRAVFEGALAELVPFIEKWRTQAKGLTRPDWVYVLDAEGRVLLRTQKPQERGDSIAGIPVVRTMLGGAALDDIWVLDDGIFVTAAAASLVDGNVAGGVVLGYKLDSTRTTALASRLPQLDGSPPGLALLWSGKVIGQSFVLNQGVTVPASSDLSVYGDGQMAFAPFPLLAPQMGRYIGTANASPGWPRKLLVAVNLEHCPAFEAIAIRQMFIIGTTLLLVLVSIFWGISIRRAVVKPLGAIVDHLSSVQQGGNVGLLPEVVLKDPYKRLGTLINMLISKGGVGSRPASGRTDLSDILGSAPAAANATLDSGTAAGELAGQSSAPAPSAPSGQDQSSGFAADIPPGAPADESSQSGIAALFADADNDIAPPPPSVPSMAPVAPAQEALSQPPAASVPAAAAAAEPLSDADAAASFMASLSSGGLASRPQAPTIPPPAAPPSAPAPPAAAPPAPAPQPDFNPERTVMVQVPDELLAASASTAAAPPPPAMTGGGDFNPDATVVAAIPQDLLQAAISDPPGDPDEAHFKDVYDQFIATRKECGEPVADLSYDRFLIKLKKNREQLIAKYGCRTVRFQVYVKSGKAALKAVPVRD